MAYRFSQLAGRLCSSSQISAYMPQGIKAHPLLAVTANAPKSNPEVREKKTLINSELGLAADLKPNSAWNRWRIELYKKRREKIIAKRKFNDANIGVHIWKQDYVTHGIFYVALALAFFAWLNISQKWQSRLRKSDWDRCGKVKF